MPKKIVLSHETVALVTSKDPELLSPETKGHREVSWEFKRLSPITKVKIPARLDTIETYQFMGFTEQVAMQLLESQHETQTPQDVARAWVIAKCNRIEDIQDDWGKAMMDAGINENIRTALLKPEHALVLYTQSLKAWLVEIIDTYYETLVDLEANILLKLSSEPIAQLRGGGDDEEPEYTIPQIPGGHLAVFKSVDGRYTKGCIREDGTVSLGRLESYFNTDFARRGGLYFTHQIWVANAYSRLINDACSIADRRTVELHVPLSHFRDIKTWELKYGDE
ncbi:hypothetical protein N0V86_004184 [Didymella sp. IMI 355093]|nr:hypothetical protein N0V86_004184 [Didymella sp. IMI 355093]